MLRLFCNSGINKHTQEREMVIEYQIVTLVAIELKSGGEFSLYLSLSPSKEYISSRVG